MAVRQRMTARDHYSYSHYADAAVADGFDALRFSGPIGRYLLETQERLLADAFAPLDGRSILDVGAGTGRAAIGLAARGAHAIALDASDEMLRVARGRATNAGARIAIGRADAHALPLGSQSVDGAVSLRVLMHALDWRQCVAELCRVARWRVVVDFPARTSAAAIESGVRRVRKALGARVEAYRVIGLGEMSDAFARQGFRVVQTHRQFVLPIALHKAVNRLGFTRAIEQGMASAGLLRALGSPVTVVAERTPAAARARS
jgi:ubiquinone/menaquinone biosynthesis C-methylase UbiE